MIYNPEIHKRKSIRLKNYDYNSVGFYFITIAIQNKLCILGNIKNGKNYLFDSGKMVQNEWLKLEKKFENIKLHNFTIMPNHFHGIIEITKQNNRCDCKICSGKINNKTQKDTHKEYPYDYKGCIYNKNTIGNIVGGFKSITTNEYIKNVKNNNWQSFNKKLWQLNYYEHIIRNEKSYLNIVEYIENNPLKWNEDKFYYTEI